MAGTLIAKVERRGPRTAGELLGYLPAAGPKPDQQPLIRSRDRDRSGFVPDDDPRPPCVRVRHALELARARNQQFAAVWHQAVRDSVNGIADWREREVWLRALLDTHDEWEAAYHRQGRRLHCFDRVFVPDDE